MTIFISFLKMGSGISFDLAEIEKLQISDNSQNSQSGDGSPSKKKNLKAATQILNELSKPLDGADLNGDENLALKEVIRLRLLVKDCYDSQT